VHRASLDCNAERQEPSGLSGPRRSEPDWVAGPRAPGTGSFGSFRSSCAEPRPAPSLTRSGCSDVGEATSVGCWLPLLLLSPPFLPPVVTPGEVSVPSAPD